MKRYLGLWLPSVLTLLVLSVTWAAGVSATVSWVAPATYNDGSTVPSTDIDHYTLSWAPVGSQAGPSGSVNVTSTSAVVAVPCGSTSFSVTVTTSATAKYPNVTSGPDGPVSYASGVTCTINPPTGLAAH